MERSYKFRAYPNSVQIDQIEKTFGACRWVYNLSLELKKAAWEANHRKISAYELMKCLTAWKRTVAPWLYDVCNPALQQSIRDLDKAFQNFFRRNQAGKKGGYPKFKSKRCSTQSFRVPAASRGVSIVDGNHIKILKLGNLLCRISRPVEGRIVSATVKRVPSGKYYVIICCTDVPEPEMPMGEIQVMGVDAGLRDLMIRSDGVKVPNPRYAKQMKKKLRREQRKLSRRKLGSANWGKQKRKVAKLHERIANQRNDHIHKATTEIVRLSQAVATENLNVKGMAKDRKIAYSVGDAGMAEAIRQLEYKCAWYGRDFVKVDRWFPSSKTCGCCGEVFKDLKRDDEQWTCPSCGAHHDRDLNAARNIAREGEILLCA